MYTSTINRAVRKVLVIILAAVLALGVVPCIGPLVAYADKTDVSDYISFATPGNLTYNGAEQGVPENATISGSGFTPGTNPVWTYIYVAQPTIPTASIGSGGKPLGAGVYTVTASYVDDENSGSVHRDFLVLPKPLTDDMLSIPAVTYNDTAQTPALTVTDGTKTLVRDTDYSVTFQSYINAGTYPIDVTGIGNYTGTASVDFVINPRSLVGATITLATGPYPYTGNAVEPRVTSVVTAGGIDLGPAGNYSYTVSYSNNILPGTATVTVTGGGSHNYSGSASTTFTISKPYLSGQVVITGEQKYGGTLTLDTSGLTSDPVMSNLGALHYQWTRGYTLGEDIIGATGESYTLGVDDINQHIGVKVIAANCDGFVRAREVFVAKADAPAAPVVTGSYTNDGTNFTYTIDSIPGAEYWTNMGYGESQDSNVFTGWSDGDGFHPFVAGNSVTFFAQIKETATHYASTVGEIVVNFTNDIAAKPVAAPAGGTFTTSQKVSLSTATVGAKIYYTTDGSAPTPSKTLYTAPFTLYNTATVKAIAVKDDMRVSEVMSATFTKLPSTYALTVSNGSGSGSYAAGTKVTITANPAPSGKVFDKWVLTSGSGTFANASSKATTFTTASGPATVTATYKTAPPLVTAIRTPLKTIYLTKGKSISPPIAFDGEDADGKAWGYNRTAKLTWTTSNKKVATVSASGKIKAIGTGTAKITAKSQNGKTLTITVKVVKKAKKLTAVAFKNLPKTLKKGSTKALTLKLSSASATNLSIKFKSSNANVLKVDKAGKLYAIKEGKAKMTITAGGKKKVVEVVVKK